MNGSSMFDNECAECGAKFTTETPIFLWHQPDGTHLSQVIGPPVDAAPIDPDDPPMQALTT